MTTGEYAADASYQQANTVAMPHLDRRAEPLALELRHYIDALRGMAELMVSGRAGATAVALAHDVEHATENGWEPSVERSLRRLMPQLKGSWSIESGPSRSHSRFAAIGTRFTDIVGS